MALPKKRTKEKNAKARKNRNKSLFNKGLLKIVAVAVIIGCGFILYSIEVDCREKETQMLRIQEEIDEISMKNEEIQRTLDSDDLSAYMERVALEERNYAYPDERRFYDTSRD